MYGSGVIVFGAAPPRADLHSTIIFMYLNVHCYGMANLVQLLPMRVLFVAVFGFLPVLLTIYDKGVGDITTKEWASFGLLILGSVLVYVVSVRTTSVQMQRYLWPLLAVMGLGLLIYRHVLAEREEWDEASVKRGATSYED